MQSIKVVPALEILKIRMAAKEDFKIALKFIKEREKIVKELIVMEKY
jgi:hypothetical protein